MRLFVAVDLDGGVRRGASGVIGELSKQLESSAPRGVSWVRADNLHVTVRFLGEVDEPTTMKVVEALRAPIRVPPFDLDVRGAGAFPPSGPPRVIWLGITAGQDSLSRIHAEVEGRLGALGFEGEDRPYRAHLTVGRVKAPLPGHPRDVLRAMASRPVGRCRVDEVTLYESRLSPRGPTYVPIVRTPLVEG